MKNITELALDRDRATIMLLLLIVVAGSAAYFALPRAEDPGYTVRTAVVYAAWPGASPRRVADLVTDPLEEAIREIPEVDWVESESSDGRTVIYVRLFDHVAGPLQPIWDHLRRKVAEAAHRLPAGTIGPFVNDEFGDVFGIVLALTGEDVPMPLLEDLGEQVRDELLALEDVSRVELVGVPARRVFLEYDEARLRSHGVSPLQLRGLLESQNVILPAGEIDVGPERLTFEVLGSLDDLEALRRTIVRLPGRAGLLRLGDLVTIRRASAEPPRTRMRAFGEPAVGIAISKRPEGNILELGDRIRQMLPALRERLLPPGVRLRIVAFQPEDVHEKTTLFEINLAESVGLVLLTMLLALGLRTGLVVASLIPATILGTFAVMRVAGIGIDQVSLASLIIALGMLVDASIVVSESIMVSTADGASPREAAIRAAREHRFPLLVAALIVSAAFLPIWLARSSTGEYTGAIFKVVSISLLVSWLLAFTATPLLAVRFLSPRAGDGESLYRKPFYRAYRRVLGWLVRHPAVTLGTGALLLVLGIVCFRVFVRQEFFPPNDKPIFFAELEAPEGTSIGRMTDIVRSIDGFVERDLLADDGRSEGVTRWAAFIGSGAPRFVLSYAPEAPRPHYAYMLFRTTSLDAMREGVARLGRFADEHLPGVRARVRPLFLGPPVDAPVEVRLSGNDLAGLREHAREVEAHLASLDGARDVHDDWGPAAKFLALDVDPERALAAGLTTGDVAISLQSALGGIPVSELREGEDRVPIVLRLPREVRLDPERLAMHTVTSQLTGRAVPLGQVAQIRLGFRPGTIRRRNGRTTITVAADLAPGANAHRIARTLEPWLEDRAAAWADGTSWEHGGEYEASREADSSIFEQLPVGALMILLLLVAKFNSFRKPLLVLSAIPPGFVGATVGLLVAGESFGFMALLGLVALSGIVISNAIVLLERIQLEIDEHGRRPLEAAVEAAQRRLRPILMTSGTTIGGLLPLWLSGGPLWRAMAVTLIFGLAFSTVGSLTVLPVAWAAAYGAGRRERRSA